MVSLQMFFKKVLLLIVLWVNLGKCNDQIAAPVVMWHGMGMDCLNIIFEILLRMFYVQATLVAFHLVLVL